MSAPIVARHKWRAGSDLAIVNSGDASRTAHRYLVFLGAYGWTKLLVWANGADDALELAGEWCEDHAPGLLCTEQVHEAYREALSEGLSEEQAAERAEEDMIALDCGRYLASWEVFFEEDPPRERILALLND